MSSEHPSPRPPELVAASERPVELTGGPATVEVAMDPAGERDVQRAVRIDAPHDPAPDDGLHDTVPDDTSPPPSILLRVEDLRAEHHPGVVYGVYLARRDGSTDELHVGNVSPFGIEHASDPDRDHATSPGQRHVFNVTAPVRALLGGADGDLSTLEVRFRAIMPLLPDGTDAPPPEPGSVTPLTIGRVSFFVT